MKSGNVPPAAGGVPRIARTLRRCTVSVTWIANRLVLADARAYNVVYDGLPPDDYVMPPGADSLGLTRVARTNDAAGRSICGAEAASRH